MTQFMVGSGASACGQVKGQFFGGVMSPGSGSRHAHACSEKTSSSAQPAHVLPPEVAVQRIADVRQHLEFCAQTLKALEDLGPNAAATGEYMPIGISSVTIRTIAACLSELLQLEWLQPHRDSSPDLCKLLDCPQQPVLRQAVCHAIDVLEQTKHRFKSKELKALREDLQELLVNSDHFSLPPESVS